MSYSFYVRAANKAEAKEKVAAELAKVVAAQPIHEIDRAQAQAAADAFVDLLDSKDTREISMSVNGSVWSRDGLTQQAGVGVSTAFVDPT